MASGLTPSGPWFSRPRLCGRRHSREIPAVFDTAARPGVAAADDPRARDCHEGDCFRFARLEPDRGARRDVEAHPVGRGSIEGERTVRFDEVIVTPDLNRTIAAVRHLKLHRLPSRVEHDVSVTCDDRAGNTVLLDGRMPDRAGTEVRRRQ